MTISGMISGMPLGPGRTISKIVAPTKVGGPISRLVGTVDIDGQSVVVEARHSVFPRPEVGARLCRSSLRRSESDTFPGPCSHFLVHIGFCDAPYCFRSLDVEQANSVQHHTGGNILTTEHHIWLQIKANEWNYFGTFELIPSTRDEVP